MKTAMFISGRLTCYDENLINILNTTFCENDIDLFVSVNGVRDEYHIEAEQRLSKWLRKIDYEEYNVPEDFINTNPESLRQTVNGKQVPYTVLSMFYNDYKNYKNIEEYSKENNMEYERCGMNLKIIKKITLKEALTGFQFALKHLNGNTYNINNSKGNVISHNFNKTIPGMGMIRGEHTGDMIITFEVVFPEKLELDVIEKLEEIL